MHLLGDLTRLHGEARTRPAVTMVRLGSPPFVAQDILPDVFTHMFEAQRHIRLQLVEGRVPFLVDELLGGKLDALLTSYPVAMAQETSDELQHERVFCGF